MLPHPWLEAWFCQHQTNSVPTLAHKQDAGYLSEGSPGDEHGTHLALGEEEGIADDHAGHEVSYMRELVGGAAVPDSVHAAVAGLQLI